MADPFEIETSGQRRVVLAALVAYAALFVYELSTGSDLAAGAADLVLAALVVPASVVAIRRATAGRGADRLAVATAAAFLVAGLAIGYEGLATLALVPGSAVLEAVGTVALLAAFVLYLYRRR